MNPNIPKKYDALKEKSMNMAVRMVNLCKHLQTERKEYILSKQIMRSGTNPGAMVREARNAESDADYIHKLSIGQKETAETQYWLELLLKTNYISQSQYDSLNSDVTEVMKLLRSSILNKKNNIKNTKKNDR